jgi:hypothetical protein
MILVHFILQLFFAMIFCLVSYLLSSQPLEPSRFIWFFAASVSVGLVSEGHGMIVGSIFSVMVRYLSLIFSEGLLNSMNSVL